MDREDEGYIVFYDAEGNIAARQLPLRSQCGHRRHGHRVRISRIRHRRNPRRDHLGEYYEQYAEYGAPIYHLTYEGETTNAAMNVPTYSSFMAQGDAESWLTAESYGPTQIYVNMDSQTAAEGVMFLYGANWNVVMVIICTLNI